MKLRFTTKKLYSNLDGRIPLFLFELMVSSSKQWILMHTTTAPFATNPQSPSCPRASRWCPPPPPQLMASNLANAPLVGWWMRSPWPQDLSLCWSFCFHTKLNLSLNYLLAVRNSELYKNHGLWMSLVSSFWEKRKAYSNQKPSFTCSKPTGHFYFLVGP